MESLQIEDGLVVNQDFILITYATGMGGQTPDKTKRFLANNHEHMKGVACSGNRNWGEDAFAKPARVISFTYKVPMILRFELSGTQADIENFKREVDKLVNANSKIY